MTYTDIAEMMDALRAIGYNEQDIADVVEQVEQEIVPLSWVADLVEAAEAGDDDEWFEAACALGLA